jgi:NitT/TauT family transport system ATP-binding protein
MNRPDDVILDIQGVTQAFGSKRILHDVNLRIPRGQFVSLVGPSGCGKSTLFRAVVGTHLTQQGEVRVFSAGGPPEGQRVTGPGRDRGIVYQKYALFPFLTALENVAIGLTLDRTSLPFRWFRPFAWRRKNREHLERAGEMLRRVRLGDALHLYPHELSGGMQQRVALAQAMVLQPAIILLDEPFGALDESTREELQLMLRELNEQNQEAVTRGEAPPLTLLIVTHELNEALFVGDRVVGLSQHWDWESEGYREFPGATVLYDRPAPVSALKNARDFDQFKAQREEIRRVVFEPRVKSRRGDFLSLG